MKICVLIIALVIFTGTLTKAQNPASKPRDTTLSPPEKNFETLWQTFEDHYAFFKLRGIDWKATYLQYRPQVTAATPDDSLYSIFTKMLGPFKDNHINLIVPPVKQFKSVKPSQFQQEFANDSLLKAFWRMVDQNLAKEGFSPLKHAGPAFRGRPLFTYTTSANKGYLRFNRCFVSQDEDNEPDARACGRILDTIFAAFKGKDKVLVDVRDNIGGNDEFSYEVAGRFTGSKIIGMYKRTRNGGYEDFGKAETWYVQPKGTNKRPGAVVVLTNDKTVSAGDVFAMIMEELPGVTLVGDNTRGIYSDMYGFTLPNKWQVSLSHQRYYNAKMVCYEGNGTPVDIRIKNTRENLQTNIDPVLAAAIKTIERPK